MGQRKLCPFDLVRQRRNGITDRPAEIDLGQVGVMETTVREIGFDTLRLCQIGFGKIDIMGRAFCQFQLFERQAGKGRVADIGRNKSQCPAASGFWPHTFNPIDISQVAFFKLNVDKAAFRDVQQPAGAVGKSAVTESATIEGRFGKGAVAEAATIKFDIAGRLVAPVDSFERLPDKFIRCAERIGTTGRGRVIDDRLPAASAS